MVTILSSPAPGAGALTALRGKGDWSGESPAGMERPTGTLAIALDVSSVSVSVSVVLVDLKGKYVAASLQLVIESRGTREEERSHVSCTTLHYTTLHYTTLHYTTLHYTTLH